MSTDDIKFSDYNYLYPLQNQPLIPFMNSTSFDWLNKKYPQNYIIRKPLIGTFIVVIFCYLFTILYRPQHAHSSEPFSFEVTLAIYSLILTLPLYFTIRMLKLFPAFNEIKNWTLLRDIKFGVILFLLLGVWNFFAGYIMESSEGRWNIYTFLDSVKTPFIMGLLPYFFFTIQNRRHLIDLNTQKDVVDSERKESKNELIYINSKLKKGHISFDPESFLYAESNANYVIFYFLKKNRIEKEMVRNSIGDVEKQLSDIPYLTRIHRAFIVNVKKVKNKKGNSSGYRIEIAGTDIDLPVSRLNVANYDLLEQDFKKTQ